MKATKYIISILLLSMVIFSCEKEFPEADRIEGEEFAWALFYSNKYILTSINSGLYKKDTTWHQVTDTVMYNNFYIKINFSGYLVSENTHYSTYYGIPNYVEQKYFINKIIDYNIYANNVNINSKVRLLKKDKNEVYTTSNIINEELGYTPLRIELTDTLDTCEKIIFNIVFTDDKGNVFTSSTDSIFITK